MDPAIRAYRAEIYDRLVERLCAHLEAVHGERHSRRYWEQLVGPWAVYFIAYTHWRWTHAPLERTAPLSAIQIPRDYTSFVLGLDVGTLGATIDALMASPVPTAPLEGFFRGAAPGAQRRVAESLARATSFAASAVMVAPYFSARCQLRIAQRSRGRVLPLVLPGPRGISEPDVALRRWRVEAARAFIGEYEARLHEVALLQLPTVHLEGYRALAAKVEPLAKRIRLVYSATGWQQDEALKLLAANVRERGGRLVGHQHGGYYGSGAPTPLNDLEATMVDLFLTWGWAGDRTTRAAFGAKLSETVRRHTALGLASPQGALYATTSGGMRFPDGLPGPSTDDMPRYLEDQLRFLRGLDPAAREELHVRPYPGDVKYPWRQRERFAASGLVRAWSEEATFVEALAKRAIFICDHNFTTILEAYACDVPSVLFFDPEVWPLHERATKLFEQMERVGLYHRTPESAAAHVNRIRAAPRAWWDSPAVVPVREEFRSTFATHDPQFTRRLADILLAEARRQNN